MAKIKIDLPSTLAVFDRKHFEQVTEALALCQFVEEKNTYDELPDHAPMFFLASSSMNISLIQKEDEHIEQVSRYHWKQAWKKEVENQAVLDQDPPCAKEE